MRRRLSALAQLVEIYRDRGVTTTAALMEVTGYSERSIWAAKRELVQRDAGAADCMVQPNAGAEGAAGCTDGAADRRVHGAVGCTMQGVPRARIESPSGILSQKEVLDSHPLPPAEPNSAIASERVCGGADLGHGLIDDGKTLRHRSFAISFAAIEMQTIASGWPREQVRNHCRATALQWAAEIEGGKLSRDVVPQHVLAFLSASIMKTKMRAEIAEKGPGAQRGPIDFVEQKRERDRAFAERMLAKYGAGGASQ